MKKKTVGEEALKVQGKNYLIWDLEKTAPKEVEAARGKQPPTMAEDEVAN